MKKCLAFSALVGSRDAWKPCSRKAIRGSAFCGRHTEVLAGVMLGLLFAKMPLTGYATDAELACAAAAAAICAAICWLATF